MAGRDQREASWNGAGLLRARLPELDLGAVPDKKAQEARQILDMLLRRLLERPLLPGLLV